MSFWTTLLKPVYDWYISKHAKAALPNYNQTLQAEALKEDVEIIRDKWAVPHIYAENQHDLFFAQGFVHAQDRLWQMELNRRVVYGEVSEFAGEAAIDLDKMMCSLDFPKRALDDAKQLEESDLLEYITAYAKGVNHFIATADKLPVEFKLLKIEPREWTAQDSLAIGRLLTMKMSLGWLHEIERLNLAQEFGLEKVQELFPEYPSNNPVAFNGIPETFERVGEGLKAFNGPFLDRSGGSNNWVVSPDKMTTGAAALCNDPHLMIDLPNIWFENHLIAPDYECTGVSIAGIPLVMIGHNRKIAWGATLSYADIQDTYIETFTGPNCLQYEYNGRILKAKHTKHLIKVKGAKPVTYTSIETHHGPTILSLNATQRIALCSKAVQSNTMIEAFYALNLAEDWNAFLEACKLMVIPSLSLVYADTNDNIGYMMTGAVPLRKRRKGLLPADGSVADYDWKGQIPFEEMPHSFNPSKGYWYTCNHKLVDDNYKYDLGEIWMSGYRANRLDKLFKKQDKYSFEHFANWQMDFFCPPGLEFVAYLKEQRPKLKLTKEVVEMLNLFEDWDGYLTAESGEGAIYQVFKQQCMEVIFEKHGDPNRLRGVFSAKDKIPAFSYTEFSSHDAGLLLRLLKNPESLWWEGAHSKMLKEILDRTYRFLTTKLGSDMETWQWGALHKMTAAHALAQKAPLDELFNLSNVPIGGDADTLNQVNFEPSAPFSGGMVTASYRQLIDMANFDNAKCIVPIGQSGNHVSQHYKDQFEDWYKGNYKPMLWSKGKIEEFAAYRMQLKKKA